MKKTLKRKLSRFWRMHEFKIVLVLVLQVVAALVMAPLYISFDIGNVTVVMVMAGIAIAILLWFMIHMTILEFAPSGKKSNQRTN